jgi:pyruvate/2-oxoglutarate dehydrogenase complex dihydrolipoamide acyltransferase (E2) component
VMVTNIGSLGIDMAFVPLVPYSRVPLIVALGAIGDRPVVVDGAVVVQKMITLSITIDHRVIDGVHASHMLRSLKTIFSNPELELKNT